MSKVAKTIETSGFESLWVYDHFQNWPISDWAEKVWMKATNPDWDDSTALPEPVQEATYEAWTMMAALASITDTVRLGQMCTCNTYRPPSYLAKVAASIDIISAGRVEMGIGAGWYEHEHDGYGYPFLGPGGRLGMLREGVEIMKALWTQDVVDYEGDYYTLKGAICEPKPLQKPHIPFWIAGGGEKVTLKIAATHASYTNFGGDIETFVRKSQILESHCEDVGTNFDEITRSSNFNILIGETEAEVDRKLDWLLEQMSSYVSEKKAEAFTDWYRNMSGTPEQVIERLSEWAEAGMSYAIVNFHDPAYDQSGLELFASQVIPALT